MTLFGDKGSFGIRLLFGCPLDEDKLPVDFHETISEYENPLGYDEVACTIDVDTHGGDLAFSEVVGPGELMDWGESYPFIVALYAPSGCFAESEVGVNGQPARIPHEKWLKARREHNAIHVVVIRIFPDSPKQND